MPSPPSPTDLREHEVACLADGRDPFEVVLGYFDVEALLEAHDQLHQIEAVGVEILLEARGLGDLLGVDAQHLGGYLAARGQRVRTFHRNGSSSYRVQWPMPKPPSTGTTAPVTYPADGEHRKAMTDAHSCAVPKRPARTTAWICSLQASGMSSVMAVTIGPGATTLQVMPRRASSRATLRVSPTRAAFAA